MTYLTDLAGDWAYTPGVETLSYTSPAGSVTAGVKANIDPAGPTYRDVQGGSAGIEPTDLVWDVWAATLALPARGGTLTQTSGSAWRIVSFNGVREEGEIVKWRCICRKCEA